MIRVVLPFHLRTLALFLRDPLMRFAMFLLPGGALSRSLV